MAWVMRSVRSAAAIASVTSSIVPTTAVAPSGPSITGENATWTHLEAPSARRIRRLRWVRALPSFAASAWAWSSGHSAGSTICVQPRPNASSAVSPVISHHRRLTYTQLPVPSSSNTPIGAVSARRRNRRSLSAR